MSEVQSATEQSSGAMSVAQAAEAFEELLEPKKANRGNADAADDKPVDDDPADDPDDAPQQEGADDADPDDVDTDDDSVKKPELHTVTVDGKEIQVPLEELVKGYQRQADYTQKTMTVAEQRKAVAAELESVRSEREHYSKMLGTLQQQIQQGEPRIDWARLAQENPEEYNRQWPREHQRQLALQNVEAEHRRVREAQQEEEAKGIEQRVTEESRKLSEAIPEWKDEKKATAEKAELVKFAQTLGYAPEEISQVLDYRAIVLLRMGYQYKQLVSKRAALKPEPAVVTRTAKPGPPAQTQVNGIDRANKRLAKSGKLADAASVFERFL